MQEESQRSRPRYQPPAQEKPAAPSPKAPNHTPKEPTKVRALISKHVLAGQCVLSCYIIVYNCVFGVGVCQTTEKDEAASMKDWILRYAAQSSDEEEDEEEEEEGGKKTSRNPELEEKFDPVIKINVDIYIYIYVT